MSSEGTRHKSFGPVLKKAGRIFLWVLFSIVLLVIILVVFIQTPYGQNIVRGKAEKFLSGKLRTRVEIGRLRVRFPVSVELGNIFIADRSKDTLLSGGALRVDLNMWKLLHSEIAIREVRLKDITAKIKRQLPDTAFNFQFIIDAFAGEPSAQPTPDSSTLKLSLNNLLLDNIRIVYSDVVTGNDVQAFLKSARIGIDSINPAQMTYRVPKIYIEGLQGSVYQHKPIEMPAAPVPDEKRAEEPLRLVFREIGLKDINVDYRNHISSLFTKIDLSELNALVNAFDMSGKYIDVESFRLVRTFASIRMGETETVEVVEEKAEDVLIDSADAGWRLKVASLELENNHLTFDDDTKAATSKGMDYAHLDAQGVTLGLQNFQYGPDSISGRITRGQLTEKNGFVLEALQTEFLYASNEAYLKNLELKTPGTRLSRYALVRYPSLDALSESPDKMYVEMNLENSRVSVKDILQFVPDLRAQKMFSNPSEIIQINSRMKGTLASLDIGSLQISGWQASRVDINGNVSNLTNPDRLSANLNIRTISTTRKDLLTLLPEGVMPENIQIPDRLSVQGFFNGRMNRFVTDLKLVTSSGNASVKGTMAGINNAETATYDLVLHADNLQLGSILKNDSLLGPFNGRIIAKGQGFDLSTARTDIQAEIYDTRFKGYDYNSLVLTANLQEQVWQASLDVDDPNARLSLKGGGTMAGSYPAVQLDLLVDSIKTAPLNLTASDIYYHGRINADFPSTNPDSLEGRLTITESLLVKDSIRIPTDTMHLVAGQSDTGRFVRLNTDFANAELEGTYALSQMGAVFLQVVDPYFSVTPDSNTVKTDPYDFTMNARVTDAPTIRAFIPELKEMSDLVLESRFSTAEGPQVNLSLPTLHYGEIRLENFRLDAETQNDSLVADISLDRLHNGAIRLYSTTLNAGIANDRLHFDLNTRDAEERNKYHTAGVLATPAKGLYELSFDPENLLLNYEKWYINQGNKIMFGNGGLNIDRFIINHGSQELSVNSMSDQMDAPVDIGLNDFQLSTLTAFINQDSLMIDGVLTGRIMLNDIMKNPTFTSGLKVTDLAFKKDTLGNLELNVQNNSENVFNASARLDGRGNEVSVKGAYYAVPEGTGRFDLNAAIDSLQLKTLAGVTGNLIKDGSGTLSGNLSVEGNMASPRVNGELQFNKAAFNLGLLNSYFRIDNEKIVVNDEGVKFDEFTLLDSAGNTAIIDGMAYTKNFQQYRFDLTMRARNFKALNTTKKDNKLYYGQLYFNSNLHIGGTESAPKVDGSVAINENTRLTVVLPQDEPGVVAREGIVQFVDMDSVAVDSISFSAYDSLKTSEILGIDVSVNVEVDKEAELNLVVDEGNGDFLRMRGEAVLNAGIDPGGKVTLAGSYEIESGTYELTFNFLKRKFNIEKGSKIIWKGEPTDADVDITAVYIANTSPLDLVENQLQSADASVRNVYRQKLPFEVNLNMTGRLLQPEISFDIVLPDDKSFPVGKEVIETVNNKLAIIRQESSELNKQVFALLLLNRFMSENPFQSSSSMSAESFARASVSKLLTEQLNQLAAELIKGVDVNFDVRSQEDYTTGSLQNRTDLNVAFSKRLLNDRLTVTVGSNFELEGAPNSGQRSANLAENISLNYQLSRDGRYMLRAYRKNEYQGILEGYIIETGVGFIITVDYNRFRQVFMSAKERERRREARRAAREEIRKQKREPVNAKGE